MGQPVEIQIRTWKCTVYLNTVLQRIGVYKEGNKNGDKDLIKVAWLAKYWNGKILVIQRNSLML